ncbi:MAG: hypothetical protein A3H17_00895 [Candidatus Levybacteria bacterium RIFCSPLOWO2_12_FULL_37_14]|nr:MAG: hypothetical protein A3H17_00895 [Candidatus Levybacteria bacterium RIFCSPLOWO2_12_FULL_37_14]
MLFSGVVLLPNNIQRRNILFLLGEKEGKEQQKQTSDGNLVNVGNSDTDGANVNNWKPDNSNDNIGVVLSRKFRKLIKGSLQKRAFIEDSG